MDGGEAISFNGTELSLKNGLHHLGLSQKCMAMDTNVSVENFISQRAIAVYIALWAYPKLLGRIQLLASRATSPSLKDIKELSSVLAGLKAIRDGLLFQPLSLDGMKVVCYSDAGFASHSGDYKSQIGYIVAFLGSSNNENVVAYASRKGKRVTRSVLASEHFALVDGYDCAEAIGDQVSEILGMQVPVWNAVDSRTLFNVVMKVGNVSEHRLMIDVAELRQKHVLQKLALFWIPSDDNCVDPFTKPTGSQRALDELLRGRLSLNPNAWVEHLAARNVSNEHDVMPLT